MALMAVSTDGSSGAVKSSPAELALTTSSGTSRAALATAMQMLVLPPRCESGRLSFPYLMVLLARAPPAEPSTSDPITTRSGRRVSTSAISVSASLSTCTTTLLRIMCSADRLTNDSTSSLATSTGVRAVVTCTNVNESPGCRSSMQANLNASLLEWLSLTNSSTLADLAEAPISVVVMVVGGGLFTALDSAATRPLKLGWLSWVMRYDP
mmetsp:Transcript_37263/g.82894  ORF Transcript_37263/g.82894 Transcript_37263/m.82894 type:complete len:210 (+) Transcript_37263:689-1318(+)